MRRMNKEFTRKPECLTYTITAAEQLMSSLRAIRIRSRISGNSLNQLEVLSLALREAFIL